jgi:hypothetical protein
MGSAVHVAQPHPNIPFRLVYPRNGRSIALVGRRADCALVRQAKKCFHAPGDTAETLDYRRMAGVVDGVMNTVVEMAGG